MTLNFRSLLILLIVWMPVVGLLFALIPDKKVASVIAGTGFVILPLLVLVSEFKKSQKNKFVVLAALVFFLCSSLPIFSLRLLNWDRDFKELSFLGIPTDVLHRASNGLYVLMLIAVGIAFYKEKKSDIVPK